MTYYTMTNSWLISPVRIVNHLSLIRASAKMHQNFETRASKKVIMCITSSTEVHNKYIQLGKPFDSAITAPQPLT